VSSVWFCNLSDYVKASVCSVPNVILQSTGTDNNTSKLMAEDIAGTWEAESGFHKIVEQPPAGSRTQFELPGSEEIDLTDPMLLDLLSNHPVLGVPHQEAQPILPFACSSCTEVQIPVVSEFLTFQFNIQLILHTNALDS
jgi:hypothetical protein